MGDTLEIFGKEYTNVAGFKAKDSSGNTLTYTRGGGGGGTITVEEIPNATGTTLQITTNGSGGSGGGQTASGTFTGDNGITVQIPCPFEPDLIRVYGDLSGDVSLRGIASLTFIKNDSMYVFSDTSSSASGENATHWVLHDMVGFNDSSLPHASYANDVLTIDMVTNTSSNRFTSGITYNYKLSAGGGSTPSATQHNIYFEFSDNTNTTIPVYYDDALLSTMITAYTPSTYGSKTVTLAQLDSVTWYEPTAIPLNTELIDFTTCTANTDLDNYGQPKTQEWYYLSDYTAIASGMTFSYTAGYWTNIGIYDSSKTAINVINVSNDSTVDQSDSNIGHGTLSGSKLPANTAYVRIASNATTSSKMSLVRTA